MDYWDMPDRDVNEPRQHPLVYAGLGIVAALMCAYFSTDLWKGLRALRWRETPCVIEKAELSWTMVWAGTHFVEVRYRYDANGRSYLGTRFRGAGESTNKRENITRYVAGQPATCFVNPKNPAQAVLRKEIHGDEWFISVLTGVSALVLNAGAIWETRRRRREKLEEELCHAAMSTN